jgi:hypothetical protein
MKRFGNVTVLFIAGFGPIVRDTAGSRELYNQNLGISFRLENEFRNLALIGSPRTSC